MTGSGYEKINLMSRTTLAFVFFYHGLVSKIIIMDDSEREIIEAHAFLSSSDAILLASGVAEIILATLLVIFRNSLLTIYLVIVILLLLLIDIALFTPHILFQAFSPVTLNMVCLVLCWVVIITHQNKGELP